MKVKFGMMMTDGRGKLGGQVASRNRSGAYVRSKVTPVNPQTAKQQAVRFTFGFLSREFSTLTANQVSAWNAATENWKQTDVFGDSVKITGSNLFSKLNGNLINAGFPINYDVPEKAQQGYFDGTLTVEADLTENSFVLEVPFVAGTSVNSEWVVIVEATPQLSNTKFFVKNLYRKIGVVPLTVVDNAFSIADLTPLYTPVFGQLDGTSNVFFRLKLVNTVTGQNSSYISNQLNWL